MRAVLELKASTLSSRKTVVALECERGLSSFDVRHRWVLGAVYDLPIGKGKLLGFDNAVANALIGGWQLSTNSTIKAACR
jgi:hypothetical protein